MSNAKRILIAPLNWGLGHATRCIPIIRVLQKQGANIVIASDGRALQLLSEEFPLIPTIHLPAYNIKYTTPNMIWNMAIQLPKILWAIINEYRAIQKIVAQESIDLIISDNRFGCFTSKAHCIFLTHQVNIKVANPFLQSLVNFGNHFWIQQFDECWIPDYQGTGNLGGNLSQKISPRLSSKIRFQYIGALSRMEKMEMPKKYQAIIVLSGPEPQRTYLEQKILLQLKTINQPFLLIQGKTEKEANPKIDENIEIIPFLTSTALNKKIMESEVVICRSGYSSIMDLVKLGKKAILIPTPGQTEQEYLATRFANRKQFISQYQENLDLKTALLEMKKQENNPSLLEPKEILTLVIKQLINENDL